MYEYNNKGEQPFIFEDLTMQTPSFIKGSGVSLQEMVLRDLKKELISPHWRDYYQVEDMIRGYQEGIVPEHAINERFAILERALTSELDSLNKEVKTWMDKGQMPSFLHFLLTVCEHLLKAVKGCRYAIQTKNNISLREALMELKKGVEKHEEIREQLVSKSELEGWFSLLSLAGSFSSLAYILKWGINMFLAGVSCKNSLKELIAWVQKELHTMCGILKLSSSSITSLKQVETEAMTALQLIYTSCVGNGEVIRPSVDPLELRGMLGVFAKVLSCFNYLEVHCSIASSKEKRTFSSNIRVLLHLRAGWRVKFLELPLQFFSNIMEKSAN